MLLVCILLMTSCTSEDSTSNPNGGPTAEARSWFNNHESEYNASILQYIDNLQWENAIVSDGKDGEVIEVPFTLKEKLSTSNENATLQNDSHRLVFVKDGQKKFKAYYIQIFADDENYSSFGKSSVYYGAPNNFSGKIFKQDLKDNVVSSLKYIDGKGVQLGATSKMREVNLDCTFFGYWKDDGSFTPIRLLYCDGGGGEDPTIGGGVTTGGGGGSSSSGGQNTTMPPPPKVPISDIKDFLKCLDVSKSAKLTVYAETMWEGNGVGHAFIGVSQGTNSAVYGYYPKKLLGSVTGQGIMGDNGNAHYNVAASMTITGAQLNLIITLSQTYQSDNYDISFHNCADFATDVLNIAGVSTSGSLDNPDTTAVILQSLPNYITGSFNAPKTIKSCL
ncbi:hypothetical protein [Flavobacterium luteolum]|uniref:hypothetical protein n=1 Tax=Flavobacterium luteolum TaxID=3003259 RepID=UPI00248E0ED8|nr:hypothetical protein [Flavobacterium luteolum]